MLHGQSGELYRVVGRQNNHNSKVLDIKIKTLIIELKKLVLLRQHKLHPYLFTRDSAMSSTLNVCFFVLYYKRGFVNLGIGTSALELELELEFEFELELISQTPLFPVPLGLWTPNFAG